MLKPKARTFLVAFASAVALATTLALSAQGATTMSANLLIDGSGENAACSQSGYDETTNPGWTITQGDPNVVCYSNTGGFPSSSTPGAPAGQGFFAGGTRGNSSMYQTVDVSGDAAAIDSGTATYDLSASLGGFTSQADAADVQATFLNSSGASIGSVTIGPVTPSDRANTTEFIPKAATAAIPAQTRSIKVTFQTTWAAGGTTDGYGSNISLTVSPSIPSPTLSAPASAVPGFDHVFLVYMENNNYSASSNTADGGAGIIGNSSAPYINSLLSQGSLLSNYYAITHNSDPNYDTIAGGSTFGHGAGSGAPTSNCFSTCTWNVPSLGDRVDQAGLTWKQYADGANGNCDTTTHGSYYPDDVPFGQFATMRNNSSYCQSHWQPLTKMWTDLQSTTTTPNFVWFDADDCNDMEACGIAAGDNWLKTNLTKLFATPAWTQQRSLLIVTFDEDGNGSPGGFGPGQSNQVATLMLGSQGLVKSGYQSSLRYDHYSTGRTIEAALGLQPLTANDQYANPINDVFSGNAGGPPPPPPPPPASQITPTTSTVAHGQPLTVNYQTDAAHSSSTNWIGIYPVGVTPGSQASLTWQYSPGTSGSVTFTAKSLPKPGSYSVYYLYNNGYSILAGPVPITLQ